MSTHDDGDHAMDGSVNDPAESVGGACFRPGERAAQLPSLAPFPPLIPRKFKTSGMRCLLLVSIGPIDRQSPPWTHA
jgi:hypothetical protein